jgi:hypothetical protein
MCKYDILEIARKGTVFTNTTKGKPQSVGTTPETKQITTF